jgi:hypothetical protein
MTNPNYNEVRTLWTDIQCEYLIDQRISRNREFWGLPLRRQICFWRSVANNINECFWTNFTVVQIRTKWNNILQDHRVSIFYVNYYIIIQYMY